MADTKPQLDKETPRASLSGWLQRVRPRSMPGPRTAPTVSRAVAGDAAALRARGHLLGAAARYEEALSLARAAGDQEAAGPAVLGPGQIALEQYECRAAYRLLERSRRAVAALGAAVPLAVSLDALGRLAVLQGVLGSAHQRFNEGLALCPGRPAVAPW